MSKIIFLDIDGVLNRLGTPMEGRTTERWHGLIGMEPELVARMNALVRKTGAEVVLSSSWRGSATWREDMRQNGLTFDFLDRTPHLWLGQHHLERGEEIDQWICEWLTGDLTRSIQSYAIIDDDSDMLPSQPFFKCDHIHGLTEQVAAAVERHLNPPDCLSCGRKMIPTRDEVAKKFTGYIWRCVCMPGNVRVSIG